MSAGALRRSLSSPTSGFQSCETLRSFDRTWGVISRAALIVALVLVQAAVAVGIVLAVRGGQTGRSSMRHTGAEVVSSSNLVEGGPHRIFDAGSHPALNVDIGNADLTIRTGNASQFDVSVSKSAAYGIFRARAPLAARKDGETIRIATTAEHSWSMGDDRMVTVVAPPGNRVIVVNAGNIKADGLRAEAVFNSANGNITVEDYVAPALHVASSNGRISLLRIVATRLDVKSSDGRVEGTALQVRDGSVESDNGPVTLGFAAGADTLVTAETSNGTVRVSDYAGAPTVATARSSGADGDASSSRTVRIGAGNGRFDVHSSNGNIYLSQSKYNDPAKPAGGSGSSGANMTAGYDLIVSPPIVIRRQPA